jgi:MYXO-CTERM domain-containing protein
MERLIKVLSAAAVWALLSLFTPVLAQETNRTNDMESRDDDDDTDYGWIGLIGLAGLLGLRRRDNRVDTDYNTRTGTTNR